MPPTHESCLTDHQWLYATARKIASKLPFRPATLEPLEVQHDAIVLILTLAPKYESARARYLTTRFDPWIVNSVKLLLAQKYRSEGLWGDGRSKVKPERVELTEDLLVAPPPLFDADTILTFQAMLGKLSRKERDVVTRRCNGEGFGMIGRHYGCKGSAIQVMYSRAIDRMEEFRDEYRDLSD